jgi:hypothetical protein
MSGREHLFLRALAVGIIVSLHFLPRCAPSGDKLAQQDQQMAEESGSAAGAGTASMVLALTP